jgi:hypothetical protein
MGRRWTQIFRIRNIKKLRNKFANLKRLSLYKGFPPFGKGRPGGISENSSPKTNLIPKNFMGLVADWPIAVIWLKTENKTQGF